MYTPVKTLGDLALCLSLTCSVHSGDVYQAPIMCISSTYCVRLTTVLEMKFFPLSVVMRSCNPSTQEPGGRKEDQEFKAFLG